MTASRWIGLTTLFLTVWLSFMAIIFVIAMLTDIDWSKSRLEKLLGAAIHRKVSFGHLSWSFGLHGLAIETNKFNVYEENGAPFLSAGRSQLGMALRPLLSGQIKLQFLNFSHPELWASRTGPGKWNFDDLLQTAYQVDFLQAEHGTIHLADSVSGEGPQAFPDLQLDDFSIKLVQPAKHFARPALLSFRVATDHTTSFKVDGWVFGNDNSWLNDKCIVHLAVNQLNTRDLPVVTAVTGYDLSKTLTKVCQGKVAGFFDIDSSFDGTFNKNFDADIKLLARDFSLTNKALGDWQTPLIESKLHLKANGETLAWSNSTIKLPSCRSEGRTEGTIANWRSGSGTTSGVSIVALVDDLAGLGSLFSTGEVSQLPAFKYLKQARGKALLDVDYRQGRPSNKFTARVQAASVTMKGMDQLIASAKLPGLALLGVNDSTAINGNFSFDSDNRVECKDCTFDNHGCLAKFSGYSKPNENKRRVEFSLKELSLKQLAETINQSSDARQSLASLVQLEANSSVSLSGKANVAGAIEESLEQGKIARVSDIETVLKDAHLAVSSPSLSFDHLNGTLEIHPDRLSLKQLTGSAERGKIEISGNLPSDPAGKLNLHLQAHNFNIACISSLLDLFKINSPVFSGHQWTGKAKEFSLDLTGSSNKPVVQLTALPDEIYYQPSGLQSPIKLAGGKITYQNDRLDLGDVVLALRGGGVTADLTIASLSRQAKLERVRLKSQGTDLKDANAYLCSSLTPPVLKNMYLNLLNTYGLSGLHGKVYGDLACTIENQKPRLNGLLGFINAGSKFGDSKQPIEHVGGVLVASGEQLLFQGLSGTCRNTKFEVDGRISQYQERDPHWAGDLRANIDPSDLTQLIPTLNECTGVNKVKLTAATPLILKAKVQGHNDLAIANFILQANPDDRLTFFSPLGILHQPTGEKLVIDGAIRAEPQKIQISEAHLTVGNSFLEMKGTLSKTAQEAKGTNSSAEPEVNFVVRSPGYVSVKSMIGLLDPSLAEDNVSGLARGSFSVRGKVQEPVVKGDLAFDRVCFPKINLLNCTGTLVTAEPKAGSLSSADGLKARLKVEGCQFGKLKFSNVSSEIEWIAALNNWKAPKLVLSDYRGSLAGGKLTASGWIDMNEHKVSLQMALKGAKADELLDQLADLKGELSGTLDADTNMQTSGYDVNDLAANVSGDSSIIITNGSVTRFGHLKTRINQVNLVHQGLFGFNLNNLLQSVAPARTGEFRKIETAIKLTGGHLSVAKLRYDGDDMQLWAIGQANLRLHTLELEIEGKIPRVSSSVIGGPIGEISREFTVQRVMNSITLHKLESLPSLPLLGDIASAKPRVFAFKVLAPYDQPKLVSQSIEKSFHWLQNKTTQTAHAVPDSQQYGQL
jgi:uncharacterized protein involved in outer membrane biogenesis